MKFSLSQRHVPHSFCVYIFSLNMKKKNHFRMVLRSYNTFTPFAEENLKALNVYDINI